MRLRSFVCMFVSLTLACGAYNASAVLDQRNYPVDDDMMLFPDEGVGSDLQDNGLVSQDYSLHQDPGRSDSYMTPTLPEGEDYVDSDAGDDGSIVKINNSLSFDKNKNMFINYVDSDKKHRFYSSVPNGMIVNGQVDLEIDSRFSLSKDGQSVFDIDGTSFTEPGRYDITVLSPNQIEKKSFEFTIINRPFSCRSLSIPENMVFDQIFVDDSQIEVTGDQLLFEKDGTYKINVSHPDIEYSISSVITVDNEAPILALEGVVDGVAEGPVSYDDLEAGATIEATLNGNSFTLSTTERVFTQPGSYHIRVMDVAGNSREYEFILKMYLTISSTSVLLIVIVIIAFTVGYCLKIRKKVRVR